MSMLLMVKAMQVKVGNPLRKLVLLKLADNANDNGECWPSYQHIADHCEVSRSTVKAHVIALEGMGLLRREFRKDGKLNKSNVFYLSIPSAPIGGLSDNLGRASAALGGATADLGGGATADPRTSHSLEPVKEPIYANAESDVSNDNKKDFKGWASDKPAKFQFDKTRIINTWNAKADEHGLPKISAISKTVEQGLMRLYKAHVAQCKQLGEKPNDIDTVINGYIQFGYEPTEWAKGANPTGKKYGITTALTQHKIDEILDAAL